MNKAQHPETRSEPTRNEPSGGERNPVTVRQGLRVLTALEISRNNPFSFTGQRHSPSPPQAGRKRSANRTLLVLATFTLVAGVVLAKIVNLPETLFMMISWLWLTVLIVVGNSTSLGMVHNYQTDWWLSYPYPRWMLVVSKWLAELALGLRWLVILTIWTFIVYMVAWTFRPHAWFPTGSFLASAAMVLLTLVIILPVYCALTLLQLAIVRGWLRVFQPIVTAATWGSYGGLAILEDIW